MSDGDSSFSFEDDEQQNDSYADPFVTSDTQQSTTVIESSIDAYIADPYYHYRSKEYHLMYHHLLLKLYLLNSLILMFLHYCSMVVVLLYLPDVIQDRS